MPSSMLLFGSFTPPHSARNTQLYISLASAVKSCPQHPSESVVCTHGSAHCIPGASQDWLCHSTNPIAEPRFQQQGGEADRDDSDYDYVHLAHPSLSSASLRIPMRAHEAGAPEQEGA